MLLTNNVVLEVKLNFVVFITQNLIFTEKI